MADEVGYWTRDWGNEDVALPIVVGPRHVNPLDCNKCGGRITYEDLTNCNITLDGGTVSSVHCPICTGASHV
jgi:hypothetical protein